MNYCCKYFCSLTIVFKWAHILPAPQECCSSDVFFRKDGVSPIGKLHGLDVTPEVHDLANVGSEKSATTMFYHTLLLHLLWYHRGERKNDNADKQVCMFNTHACVSRLYVGAVGR